MANTLQAKKRVRRNAKREDINKARRSRIRTYVKKVELALKKAQPELMRGVTKGVLHKKTASRKVSRLAKRVKALG